MIAAVTFSSDSEPSPYNNCNFSTVSGKKVASQSMDNVEESDRDKLLKKIREFENKVNNFTAQHEQPLSAKLSTISALIESSQDSTLTRASRDGVEASFMSEAVSDSKQLARTADTEIAKLTAEKESLMSEVESYRKAQGKVDSSITKELGNATQKLDAAVMRVAGMKELLKGEDINLNSNIEQTTPPPSFRQ